MHDNGNAYTIGSIRAKSPEINTGLPNKLAHKPIAVASFAWKNSNPTIVATVPTHILAYAPCLVTFFQYKAQKYEGKNVEAQIPIKIEVDNAMIWLAFP